MLRLFRHPGRWSNFFRDGVRPFFLQYIHHFDFPENKPEDPHSDILLLDRFQAPEVKNVIPYLDKGFKCIIDNVWEDRLNDEQIRLRLLEDYGDSLLCILGANSKWDGAGMTVQNVPSWFWIHEHFWTKDINGDTDYRPKHINDKLFLMPMLKARPIRAKLFEMTKEWHKEAFVSLVDRDVFLPGEYGEIEDMTSQRKMNPDWYDRTLFSIAVETCPAEDEHSSLFITEKTYKPLAFFHPFMTVNKPRSLQWLREQGFETYDNIFDESYDEDEDVFVRIDKVLANIHHFEYDALTLEKMEHNHHWFYNEDEVRRRAESEIINPIREFLA